MHVADLETELSAAPDRAWLAARDAAQAGPHLGDGWIAYRRALGSQPVYLRMHGAVPAVGVGFLARSRWRVWRRPIASFDRLPVPLDPAADRDPEQTTSLARAVAATARRARWASVAVDSFDGPTPPADLAAAGFVARDRFEFSIDLHGDDETRWSAVKSSHRRKVRKAEQAGVRVEATTEAAAALHRLQKFTSDRRAEQGESMDWLSEDRYRLLCDTLTRHGGGALVMLGKLHDEVVSAMLIAVFQRRAYYLLGGTDDRGLEANAASTVFWEASRELHRRGVTSLNLGGTPASAADPDSPAHGLYRFKLGWGCAAAPCRSGSLSLLPRARASEPSSP